MCSCPKGTGRGPWCRTRLSLFPVRGRFRRPVPGTSPWARVVSLRLPRRGRPPDGRRLPVAMPVRAGTLRLLRHGRPQLVPRLAGRFPVRCPRGRRSRFPAMCSPPPMFRKPLRALVRRESPGRRFRDRSRVGGRLFRLPERVRLGPGIVASTRGRTSEGRKGPRPHGTVARRLVEPGTGRRPMAPLPVRRRRPARRRPPRTGGTAPRRGRRLLRRIPVVWGSRGTASVPPEGRLPGATGRVRRRPRPVLGPVRTLPVTTAPPRACRPGGTGLRRSPRHRTHGGRERRSPRQPQGKDGGRGLRSRPRPPPGGTRPRRCRRRRGPWVSLVSLGRWPGGAGPRRLPERPRGPHRFPGRLPGPHRFPGRPTGPLGFPGRLRGPRPVTGGRPLMRVPRVSGRRWRCPSRAHGRGRGRRPGPGGRRSGSR
jgi:hypothetical protein